MSNALFHIDEDPTVLERFGDQFEHGYNRSEELLLHLEVSPDDRVSFEALVDAVHQLYSATVNANVFPLIEPLATFDDFLKKLRRPFNFRASYAQVLTLYMDRFMAMAREVTEQYGIGYDLIQFVQTAIAPLAQGRDADEAMESALRCLTGAFSPARNDLNEILFFDESLDSLTIPSSNEVELEEIYQVVRCKLLAESIDTRHRFWKGRSQILVRLALLVNKAAGTVVEDNHLVKAVYLHDFPMISLSDELLYKRALTHEEFETVKLHPQQAYGMAFALNCGEACADIVHQHHERPDGRGYPLGLTLPQICEGAKLLAICDAYFAMTHEQYYRPNRRNALRAVAEINACKGTQFDSDWVAHFNRAVREHRVLHEAHAVEDG